jgi:alpha-1,4-digalacturonate transport system permease protein
MNNSKKSAQRTGRAIYAIAAAGLVLFTIFPVLWIVLSSFKLNTELFSVPMSLFPKHWTFENYISAFSRGNFFVYFSNSVIVTVTSTVITVIINIMAGYALSKYRFPGRDIIFTIMIAMLMVPLQVIMIPIFLQLKSMHLINSLWGLIIPPAASPTGIFISRQYMQTLPDSLIEAARIDGGSEWFIFRKIIFPLAKPVAATITIFAFMWRWNDYLWPLIVITRNSKMTIQQGLRIL